MGETIAKLTGLEYKKDSSDRYYWIDTESNERVAEAAALEAFGYGADDKQESVEATWHVNGHDFPVKVVGAHDQQLEGKDYLKIEGSDTAIPRDQVTWPEKQPETDLAAENAVLARENGLLRHELKEANSKIDTLEKKIDELGEKLEQLMHRLEDKGDTVAEPPEADTPEPTEPATEESAATVPENQDAAEESNERRRGNVLHRVTGRVGRAVLGTQAKIHNGLYNISDRNGRREVIIEEVRDEKTIGGYTEHERRRGAAALIGGAALVGAGVLAGWLIWGRHGGHDVINHYYYDGNEVAGPPAVPGAGGGSNAANVVHDSHVDFFNAAPGHRRTGVMWPKELHTANVSGHKVVLDNHNNVVLGHSDMPKGISDRQGNLSVAARKKLRAMGYVLSQTKLGRRYMTFVQDA